MLSTYLLLVAMVAFFLALVVFLAAVAYDVIVVPPWEDIRQALARWASGRRVLVASWWAGHVTGEPTGRHVRRSA